jgi:hypothetical protein
MPSLERARRFGGLDACTRPRSLLRTELAESQRAAPSDVQRREAYRQRSPAGLNVGAAVVGDNVVGTAVIATSAAAICKSR